MRVACVLIPHFAVQVELRRRPRLLDRPVLIARRQGTRPVVLDASPSAGIAPGTPLEAAHAQCKDAALVEADPSAYGEAWNAVLDSLEQRSPIVENAGLGCAYVDLTGLDALYGGSARVASAVLGAVPLPYGARLGAGLGKFPAYVAAQQANTGQARLVPEDVQGYLAPVSVDLLPIPWEVQARLHQFGLHTLGDLAARPLGPLQAQFGRDGALAWQLAQGRDSRLLLPRPHTATVMERLDFSEPTTSVGTVLLAVDLLLGRAYRQAGLQGKAARVLELTADLLGAGVWHRRLTGREPYGDKASALYAVKAALDGLTLPCPVTGLAIELAGLVGATGKQASLFTEVRAKEQLAESLRQLSARLGAPTPIYRYQEVEPWSRIPERRGVLVPFGP